MRNLPETRAGVTPCPDDSRSPIPERVEGPDEGLRFLNGIFPLGSFQVRAIVVPPGEPDPAEGLPRFVVAMTRGYRLVVVSEGPTESALAWQATMQAEYVKLGRDLGLLDWRHHEENLFGTRRA